MYRLAPLGGRRFATGGSQSAGFGYSILIAADEEAHKFAIPDPACRCRCRVQHLVLRIGVRRLDEHPGR